MPKYRLKLTNGTDRTYMVSGDSVAECIDALSENAAWEKWRATFEEFNYTPQEIEEERNCGFYLGA